jgi:anti-anti-sigma factor
VSMKGVAFNADWRVEDGGAMVTLAGELDIAGVELLEQTIDAARASGRWLTIDLRALEFIDSSGLRVLLGLHNAAVRDGFDYTLIAGPPQVHRAFALCGLDQTLSFAP